jgi:hypothetical protein
MYPDIVHVFQSILVFSLLMAYLQCLAIPSYHLSPLRPSQTQLKISMALVEYILVLLWAFKSR